MHYFLNKKYNIKNLVFSESSSLGEIGSLTYKDVKKLFCGGGEDIGGQGC